MGDASMSVEHGIVVEQQPKPNVSEQSPSRNEEFSLRLARIREHAQKVAWLPIDQKFQALDNRKGILKIPVALEKRRLVRQKENMQIQLEQADKLQPDKTQRDRQRFHFKQEKPLRQNKEESLSAVGDEIRNVISEYELLAQEIIQGGTIPAEIREAYIQHAIEPKLNNYFQGQSANDKKVEFYKALQSRIDHRKETDAQKKPYEQEFYRLMKENSLPIGYPVDVISLTNPLLRGYDELIILSSLATIAASDIEAIKRSVFLQLKSKDSKKRFLSIYSDIFDEGLNPRDIMDFFNKPTFLSHLRESLRGHNNIIDMDIWQALKSSKTANEIFGEVIKGQDQKNYATALDESFLDIEGFRPHIDLLRYYPTPDAIRNLVLIAASYATGARGNDRANSAYVTLHGLSERPDWQEVLDKAERVYPSLKIVRPALESLDSLYDGNPKGKKSYEELRWQAEDFALYIFESNAADPRVTALATKALIQSNRPMLEILTKKAVLQDSEVKTLKAFEMRRQKANYYEENIVIEIFKEALRENLQALMKGDETADKVQQRLEVIRRLEALSRITLENELNHQAFAYLKDDRVVKKLQDPSLKQENVEIFLEAFRTVPALTEKRGELDSYELKYELCWEFVKQFKGSETIQLFNDLSATYSSYPHLLIDVVRSVGKSEISNERAMELPSKASDIFQAGFFPVSFLVTDQDIEFFKKMLVSYDHHKENIGDVARLVLGNRMTREMALFFPQQAPALMQDKMRETRAFIFANSKTLLRDSSDIAFLNNFVEMAGKDTDYLLNNYVEGIQKGTITQNNRNQFLETCRIFTQTHTAVSPERISQFQKSQQSAFGRAITDLNPTEIERNKMLFDYACFTERFETNKVELLRQAIKRGYDNDRLNQVFEYLRWLPETEVLPQDTIEKLEVKYNQSKERLKTGFRKMFPNTQELASSHQSLANLHQRLDEVCEKFKLDSRRVTVDGRQVNLPVGFVKEFNILRRQDPKAQFIPELVSYLISETSKVTTAYTIEDLIFSQIGETQDVTGRRRGSYTAEQLLQVMENNIEASLFTWTSAIGYQKEQPDSPLFIIANERTGPADLAAEYLPKDFADRFKVLQTVDYDKVFDWFKQNEELIEKLYDRFQIGEDVKEAIPAEIISLLGTLDHSIIPIYRLKVPSSLNAATEEPEGINTVLNFLRFSSILGGRTLFMDESTRSAPRSIECLYNVLNRRQEKLGGARIRLFGKINGAKGQGGTLLQEVNPDSSHLEIAFIDPWHSETKSITDDSAGFVPEIQGKGIVEIVRPSFTSVSPYGISTIQDFWKQLIANEVALRYEGFSESGGAKKSREEFKPTRSQNDEIFTQTELKDMAFQQTYQGLILDLDGTIGARGKYNPQIIGKIKELAENGVDVLLGTSRSLINNPQYDGSVESFIQQLGQLSETQKTHINLATENAAVISSISNVESSRENVLMSEEFTNNVSLSVLNVSPNIKVFKEQATLLLRGFTSERKTETMDILRQEIERLGLPLKVVSDSPHSIHVRVGNATKRNALNWLESKGINVNNIAKIGDSPSGNDKDMFWGHGAFNVGSDRSGTIWTIHMDEYGGGPEETERLLERLQFINV